VWKRRRYSTFCWGLIVYDGISAMLISPRMCCASALLVELTEQEEEEEKDEEHVKRGARREGMEVEAGIRLWKCLLLSFEVEWFYCFYLVTKQSYEQSSCAHIHTHTCAHRKEDTRNNGRANAHGCVLGSYGAYTGCQNTCGSINLSIQVILDAIHAGKCRNVSYILRCGSEAVACQTSSHTVHEFFRVIPKSGLQVQVNWTG